MTVESINLGRSQAIAPPSDAPPPTATPQPLVAAQYAPARPSATTASPRLHGPTAPEHGIAPTTTPTDRPTNQIAVTPATIGNLPQLLAGARPGTVVQLAPGTYRDPLMLDGVRGVTLRGGPGVVFDSGVEPPTFGTTSPSDPNFGVAKTWKPYYPPMEAAGLINIRNSSNVRLENLAVRNSWPNGISINDSQGVAIHHLDVVGCTNAVWASGRSTKGISIENSKWNQDPTGAVWKSLDWQQVHDGAYASLNGALFQARDIGGDVLIRNNDVRNAFNGVRITSNTPELGRHVRIINNRFTNISDNVVEPEVWASHWRFQGNTMEGVHAPVSLDDVGGRDFLVSGNTFLAQQRPRAELKGEDASDERHDGVKFFKLRGDGHNGTRPPLSGLRIVDNTFVIGPFPTRFADGEFPPGTVRLGNHVQGYARYLRER